MSKPFAAKLTKLLRQNPDVVRAQLSKDLGASSRGHVAKLAAGEVPPPGRDGVDLLADRLGADRVALWEAAIQQSAPEVWDFVVEERARRAADLSVAEWRLIEAIRAVEKHADPEWLGRHRAQLAEDARVLAPEADDGGVEDPPLAASLVERFLWPLADAVDHVEWGTHRGIDDKLRQHLVVGLAQVWRPEDVAWLLEVVAAVLDQLGGLVDHDRVELLRGLHRVLADRELTADVLRLVDRARR